MDVLQSPLIIKHMDCEWVEELHRSKFHFFDWYAVKFYQQGSVSWLSLRNLFFIDEMWLPIAFAIANKRFGLVHYYREGKGKCFVVNAETEDWNWPCEYLFFLCSFLHSKDKSSFPGPSRWYIEEV